MKIRVWNIYNNKDINEYLTSLVNDYRIDTLVLAEYNGKYDALENLLKETNVGKLMGTDHFMIIGDFNEMPYSMDQAKFNFNLQDNKEPATVIEES